jgi:hypothetical protein
MTEGRSELISLILRWRAGSHGKSKRFTILVNNSR